LVTPKWKGDLEYVGNAEFWTQHVGYEAIFFKMERTPTYSPNQSIYMSWVLKIAWALALCWLSCHSCHGYGEELDGNSEKYNNVNLLKTNKG